MVVLREEEAEEAAAEGVHGFQESITSGPLQVPSPSALHALKESYVQERVPVEEVGEVGRHLCVCSCAECRSLH